MHGVDFTARRRSAGSLPIAPGSAGRDDDV